MFKIIDNDKNFIMSNNNAKVTFMVFSHQENTLMISGSLESSPKDYDDIEYLIYDTKELYCHSDSADANYEKLINFVRTVFPKDYIIAEYDCKDLIIVHVDVYTNFTYTKSNDAIIFYKNIVDQSYLRKTKEIMLEQDVAFSIYYDSSELYRVENSWTSL